MSELSSNEDSVKARKLVMVDIYISIGSNIEPVANIQSGVSALYRQLGPLRLSRVYESEAVGFVGENFLNLVAAARVDMSITEVSDVLHDIEDAHRRDRAGERFSPRTLDLDLLLYGDEIYAANGLHIPRDEITKNAFVLLPLAEIAPTLVHPVEGIDYQTMWQRYDQASQRLWPIAFEWPVHIVIDNA